MRPSRRLEPAAVVTSLRPSRCLHDARAPPQRQPPSGSRRGSQTCLLETGAAKRSRSATWSPGHLSRPAVASPAILAPLEAPRSLGTSGPLQRHSAPGRSTRSPSGRRAARARGALRRILRRCLHHHAATLKVKPHCDQQRHRRLFRRPPQVGWTHLRVHVAGPRTLHPPGQQCLSGRFLAPGPSFQDRSCVGGLRA